MNGPHYVWSNYWHENADPNLIACEGWPADTIFLPGGPGCLDDYSIELTAMDFSPEIPPSAPPPKADDRTFVIDSHTALDGVCRCNADAPLEIPIAVTRYAGPTQPDGTLTHVDDLKQSGFIGEYAKLLLMVWDTDMPSDDPFVAPEMNRVFFNDELVTTLHPGNPQFLEGSNGQWTLNTLLIPIEKVKFPAEPGISGQPPVPAVNTIRVEVDLGNKTPVWCTSIDWVAIEIEAASPIILVHGISSEPQFFERHQFVSPLVEPGVSHIEGTGLVAAMGLVLGNGLVSENGKSIRDQLVATNGLGGIANEFGVDSYHLVCHSKGGLDAREFLGFWHSVDSHPQPVSFVSLSTPHNGSIHADLMVAYYEQAEQNIAIILQDFPFPLDEGSLRAMLGSIIFRPGYRDLTTGFAAAFSEENAFILPYGTEYHVIAADADTNGSNTIDSVPEWFALTVDDPDTLGGMPALLAQPIVNSMYQLLRSVQSITFVWEGQGANRLPRLVPSLTTEDLRNDTLVTVSSGRGDGPFRSRIANTWIYFGQHGRNHSSIGESDVAARVVEWLMEAERSHGDLQPR